MSGFDDKSIDIVERLKACADLDETEGATLSVVAMTREAAEVITQIRLILQKRVMETGTGAMKFSVQELRPEVLAFALFMEERLRDKDADKGQSWKEKSLFGLSTAALAKASFVQTDIAKNKCISKPSHAVDIANYCMMIADVAGALALPEEPSEEWKRDDKRTHHTLLLVGGHDVNQSDIKYWADEDCRLAEEWAQCLHLHASDNEDVVVPKVPACVVPFLER